MPLWIIAIILGLVEGITEFLPISSTGHLILASDLLQFSGEIAGTCDIAIQSGAILAVVWLYRRDFIGLVRPMPEKRFSGIPACWLLFLTTAPALVLGLVARGWIKQYLFTPLTVSIALVLGGIVLVFVERLGWTQKTESLDQISAHTAFFIGIFQCLAMWPGVSRSAATIIGGMLLGLNRKLAAQYSFLAAVPVLLAATAYELYKSMHLITPEYVWFLLLGTLVSFVSALLAIECFIKILQKYTLAPFGYYRILLGFVFLAIMWKG